MTIAQIFYFVRKALPLLMIMSMFCSCSMILGPNEAQVAGIHTQVAQAIYATRTLQAALDLEDQQTAEAGYTLTPSSTIPPTSTDLPTLTVTLKPSLTPSETLTPTSTETPTSAYGATIPENAIFFYLTLLGTGGSIGCGDSLIKLTTGQTKTGDVAADLKVALDSLFSIGQYAAGAYNATYPSVLRVDQVNLSQDGTAVVILSGTYVKPNDSCDASRYRSQVWATALQFKEIKRFEPYIGNSLLGDRLAVFSDSGK